MPPRDAQSGNDPSASDPGRPCGRDRRARSPVRFEPVLAPAALHRRIGPLGSAGSRGRVGVTGDDRPQDPAAERDPTEQDPAKRDPTEGDPTEGDPAERDPTERDPTERDPAERDLTEVLTR